MVYFVAYELRSYGLVGYRPRADYERVIAAIKAMPGSCLRIGESKWLLDTSLSALQIRDQLAPLTYGGDEVFVMRAENEWAGASLSQAQLDWLHSRNFSGSSGLLSLLGMFSAPVPAPEKSSQTPSLLAALLGKQP